MTEVPTTHDLKPPESDPASALRLLPWMNLEGRPAYLSTNGGFLSGLADEIEQLQLGSAVDVFGLDPDGLAEIAAKLRAQADRLDHDIRPQLLAARADWAAHHTT
jgi:hypothetical protein